MKQILMLMLVSIFAIPAVAMSKIDFDTALSKDSKQLVLFVGDVENLQGVAAQVNNQTNGQLAEAINASGFDGKMGKIKNFYGLAPYSHILVVGSKATADYLSEAQVVDLGGYAAKGLKKNASEHTKIVADGLNTSVQNPAAYLALGFTLQDYKFGKYKVTSEKPDDYAQVTFISADAASSQVHFTNDLSHLAQGVYLARDMASETRQVYLSPGVC